MRYYLDSYSTRKSSKEGKPHLRNHSTKDVTKFADGSLYGFPFQNTHTPSSLLNVMYDPIEMLGFVYFLSVRAFSIEGVCCKWAIWLTLEVGPHYCHALPTVLYLMIHITLKSFKVVKYMNSIGYHICFRLYMTLICFLCSVCHSDQHVSLWFWLVRRNSPVTPM